LRPLIVVEGSDAEFGAVLAEVRDAGWTVVAGWDGREGEICSGTVSSAEDAAAALLAALGGAGVVVSARAERDIVDRLCDDLRRLGPLDHRVGEATRAAALTSEERSLVDLLLEGTTLGEAARRLGLSRRTADRRLASVREKMGVETTAAALVEIARRRSR
jgi:DNA-binding NarL/FixJ family response regulator